MKAFELTMRLKNNLIKKRRIELGMTPREAAERSGMGYPVWLQYEALTLSPISAKTGKWKPTAIMMSEFLGVALDELFPGCILAVKDPVITAELSEHEMAALSGGDPAELDYFPAPDEMFEQKEAIVKARALLDGACLDPRQKSILMHRFGMDDGGDGKTLDEVSTQWSISKERARIIEHSALISLRKAATR